MIDAELEILQALGWDCEQPISFNKVLEVFTCQGILYSSDKVARPVSSPTSPAEDMAASGTSSLLSSKHMASVSRETHAEVEKYVDFFRLICLQDISFFNEN